MQPPSIVKLDHSRLWRKRGLDIMTLCAFGITQPLLSALSRQSVYLYDQQVNWLEISVLFIILLLIIPLGFILLDRLASNASRLLGGYGRNAVVVFLLGIVLLSLARPYLGSGIYNVALTMGIFAPAVAFPMSWILVRFYERNHWLQTWLTCLSIGLLLFPMTFLWQYYQMLTPLESVQSVPRARTPVPVVLVVFDEFSGTTLWNDQGEIDAERFPQFARLARLSTWYRNATTVSARTDIAVPSLLSGRFPESERYPLATEYPDNIFELVEKSQSFEMTVFEPITRLCPKSIDYERPPDRAPQQKLREFLYTVAAVYPRLIFTIDTPIPFPVIPRPWFGLPSRPLQDWGKPNLSLVGRKYYGGCENRDRQLDHFLQCLVPSKQPGFRFLHVVLPHYPWSFLPSGAQYESEFGAPEFPAGARGALGEDWDHDPATVARNEYRYHLQVGFVDRFIGQLIDRLEESGLLEQALLIVTADHGVAFRPGHSRRLPDEQTLEEILSVPLFIKTPGQKSGRTDDRNLETVDVMPTIASIVGIDPPGEIDGLSATEAVRRPRKSIYFNKSTMIIEPDFLTRRRVHRESTPAPPRKLDQPPPASSSHPEWNGFEISRFDLSEYSLMAWFFDHQDPHAAQRMSIQNELVPRFVSGVLAAADLSTTPAEIVLAVDGIIIDTAKTCWIENDLHGFELFIPESIIPSPIGNVEVFLVDVSGPSARLQRLIQSN